MMDGDRLCRSIRKDFEYNLHLLLHKKLISRNILYFMGLGELKIGKSFDDVIQAPSERDSRGVAAASTS